MTSDNDLTSAVRAVLVNAPIVNLQHNPITIRRRDDGALVLEGEVEDIITKRRAVRLAATVPGVQDVLDHLRLIPGEPRGDGHILDSVYEALCREPVFHGCTLVARAGDEAHKTQSPPDNPIGLIEIAVENAVVTLGGHVQSLSHKRLAHVLAWWAPGSTDVDDRIRVVPPEQDNDDEITDALHMVFEKDPWLDAGQIRILTYNREVRLEGVVPSREQRHMAECDAWYIPGVHKVIDHLEVRP